MRRTFLSRLERVDAVLLAGALAGLVLYLFVLPRVHPDRAAREHAPRDSVVQTARTFLYERAGEELEDDPRFVRIRRNTSLLDSLQQAYGRTGTVRRIREDHVPAYYWEVTLTDVVGRAVQEEDEEEMSVSVTSGEDEIRQASIRLTLDGTPYAIELDEPLAVFERVHEPTLLALISDSLQRELIDSVGADRWTFRLDNIGPPARRIRGSRLRIPEQDSLSVHPFYLAPEARVILDGADAVAIARHHLNGTFYAESFRVDSVEATGLEGRATATVHISSTDSSLGRRYTAAVEIAPTGALIGIEPTFVRSGTSNGPDLNDILEIVQIIAFTILAIIALFVFLRRLRHQLIDAGAAFRDGVLATLAAFVGLVGSVMTEVNAVLSFESLMILVGLVMISLFGGVLVFFLSAAATSTARDEWADKLQTLDLMRQAYVRNVPVGRAILRGTMIGLAVTGVLALGLSALPVESVVLSGDPLFFTGTFPTMKFFAASAGAAFGALLTTYLVILGVGSILVKRTSSPVVVMGVVTIALTATIISPLELRPLSLSLVLSAVVGVLLAWSLWRFDVLAVMVSIFTFILLWQVLPGWVVSNTPEFVDALLSLLVVGSIGALGFVGVAGGRAGEDVPTIVPEYIESLTRRERLERELELARSMQLSFLPSGTPQVRGLDLASVCLPAYEVGGDYYDFFRLDDGRLGFVVGDVSGKGMEAAFYMTLMKGILQGLFYDGVGPARILMKANELFRMNAAKNTFMSMAVGIFDVDDNVLTFARAGHNPLLLRRSKSDRLDVLKPGGAALGLTIAEVFDRAIEEVTIPLEHDDVLVVYTDGVTEAMNPRRELYGEERLEAVVVGTDGSAAHLLARIVDDVEEFCRNAPSHDDMTLLVARLDAGATRPGADS